MVQSSKILTVSYGTFSCTLEGFDDPLGAMKLVAEYFRDLAADDRYFGSEPPQADPLVLRQLAQDASDHPVTAEVAEDHVVLRRETPDAGTGDAFQTTRTEPEHPAAQDMSGVVELLESGDDLEAEAESEPEAVTEADVAAEVEADVVPVDEADDQEEEPAANAPSAATSVAEKLERIRQVVQRGAAGAAVPAAAFSNGAAGDAAIAPDETTPDETPAPDLQDETPEPAAEAATADVAEAPVEATVGDDEVQIPDAEAAPELPDAEPAEDAVVEAIETTEDPEPEPVHDMMPDATPDLGGDMAPPAEPAEDDYAVDALSPEAEAALAAALNDEPATEADADMPPAEVEADAGPEADDPSDEIIPDAQVAIAGVAEDDGDAGTEVEETAAQAAPDADDDDDWDEADLSSAYDDGDDDLFDEDQPAAAEAAEAEPEAVEEDSAAAEQTRERPRGAAVFGDGLEREEAALARLLKTTNSKLDGPDQARRHAALQQLKAAVAATEAERKLSRPRTEEATDDPREDFRRDLASATRLRRIEVPKPVEERPSPLVLVSDQRVEEEDAVTQAEPLEPAADDDSIPATAYAEATSFADFAERIGANSLPEMLEAAAAYTSIVEGKPRFSRAQVMSKIARINLNESFSKEAGLRSFGKLLREGKILRVQDGQFAISQSSRYSVGARSHG